MKVAVVLAQFAGGRNRPKPVLRFETTDLMHSLGDPIALSRAFSAFVRKNNNHPSIPLMRDFLRDYAKEHELKLEVSYAALKKGDY